MNELEKLRSEIEIVDEKMKKLFLERMSIILGIKKYKDEHNTLYYDKEREDYLKSKYSSDISIFKDEYLKFLDDIFEISKELMVK